MESLQLEDEYALVKKAIHCLYALTDQQTQREANAFLIQWQSSQSAWLISHRLLKDQSVEVAHFGAQVLRTKIQRDWSQIDLQQQKDLGNSILEHLSTIAEREMNRVLGVITPSESSLQILITRLSIAYADYALQHQANEFQEVINAAKIRLYNPSNILSLLEIFLVLPEELSTAALSSPAKVSLLHQLRSISSSILQITQQVLQSTQIQHLHLKCIQVQTNWIPYGLVREFSNGIALQPFAQAITSPLPTSSPTNHVFDAICDLFAALFSNMGIRSERQVEDFFLDTMAESTKQIPILCLDTTSKYLQMMVSYVESRSRWMIDVYISRAERSPQVEVLLRGVSKLLFVPDQEITSTVLQLWDTLSEYLDHEPDTLSLLRQTNFSNIVADFAQMLFQKLVAQRLASNCIEDDDQEERDSWNKAATTFCGVFPILQKALIDFFVSQVSKGHPDSEVAIFFLGQLAGSIGFEEQEEAVLQNFIKTLLTSQVPSVLLVPVLKLLGAAICTVQRDVVIMRATLSCIVQSLGSQDQQVALAASLALKKYCLNLGRGVMAHPSTVAVPTLSDSPEGKELQLQWTQVVQYIIQRNIATLQDEIQECLYMVVAHILLRHTHLYQHDYEQALSALWSNLIHQFHAAVADPVANYHTIKHVLKMMQIVCGRSEQFGCETKGVSIFGRLISVSWNSFSMVVDPFCQDLGMCEIMMDMISSLMMAAGLCGMDMIVTISRELLVLFEKHSRVQILETLTTAVSIMAQEPKFADAIADMIRKVSGSILHGTVEGMSFWQVLISCQIV
eukprot:TRINITY_DN8086_c0_g1_i3.p1 TRINITY_DN8086_c0_g1~~TRINITY_DN8086_c0_g1_i3.p1  ORF type:complete len:793 (+),score=161.02 TRINITY_DN8086_c0_g1_i3:68-2446(+)